MTLEKESNEDDQVIDIEGLKVFIDPRSIPYLNGTEVDYVDGENGSGFTFENPNAKDTCGCGECFRSLIAMKGVNDGKNAGPADPHFFWTPASIVHEGL